MKKVSAAAAVLFSVVVAASSCSSTQPNSTTQAEQPAYPEFLSAEDKATIAYRDTLRTLDPCGYLDDAAIRRIGTPTYIGAESIFSWCTVRFASPSAVPGIGSISAAMMRSGSADATHQVGEVKAWTIPSAKPGEFCRAGIPVDDRSDIVLSAYADPDARADEPKGDLCATALDLARATVPHRLERPLRATSQRAHINSRLATLDPCSVLGTIAQGHRPALASPDADPYVDPWKCEFLLNPDDGSTAQIVRYMFESDAAHMTAKGTRKETTIGGLRATEDPTPGDHLAAGTCEISLSTAPQPPVIEPGAPTGRADAGYSEIITIRALNGCAPARTTAEELARLYRQLPG
ncbi:DUF3558 domain-containing protein [Nocardia iowensis]|uniref:DUF3558 domain-containing protein n=1 Tax=Nocardia iowensis TaxID=204891 RepID=A0ABX8RG41_NOCIO|nr:DUF3558 domain-containing protein [Nocardia iowensis]QXN88331.1 DUF3558 domain-containing protein [Nocardia iowensis]